MKRVLPFGAIVLVATGLGFLPMIGCLASVDPGSTSEQDADDADVPLTPQAERVPRVARGHCGVNGLPCCAHPCCFDGSVCVYKRLTRTCVKNPPRGARRARAGCEVE